MLSEGKYGIDNVFWLMKGVLRLALDKESYERAGIVGKPDGVKGERSGRPRWRTCFCVISIPMTHFQSYFES